MRAGVETVSNFKNQIPEFLKNQIPEAGGRVQTVEGAGEVQANVTRQLQAEGLHV